MDPYIGKLFAAVKAGNLEVVRYCLARPGDRVNCQDSKGDSLLHVAARKGHRDVVELLLEAGANPYNKNNGGEIPLHEAAFHGHTEVVALLLGIAKYLINEMGALGTPLSTAALKGHTDIVKLLLERGAKTNVTAIGGTPLHNAVFEGHIDIVELLLEYRADVNAKSFVHITPLHNAVSKGYLNIVELLLTNGADVNAKTIDGEMPLHKSFEGNKLDIAKVLIAWGADVEAKARYGKLLLDCAKEENRAAFAELIKTDYWMPRQAFELREIFRAFHGKHYHHVRTPITLFHTTEQNTLIKKNIVRNSIEIIRFTDYSADAWAIIAKNLLGDECLLSDKEIRRCIKFSLDRNTLAKDITKEDFLGYVFKKTVNAEEGESSGSEMNWEAAKRSSPIHTSGASSSGSSSISEISVGEMDVDSEDDSRKVTVGFGPGSL